MPYVLTFVENGASNPALVGGKGANLGRLTAAGFLVPEGFTVTTDAYSALLISGALSNKITDICAALDYGDPERLETQTAHIREFIAAAELPVEVAQAVRVAYRALGDKTDGTPFVAVRSSGTAEDLAEASFAGLHDTFLDVRGETEVEDAIRACWASMWTARATAYRHKNGFDHDSARLAVVVQIMVEAEVAGVMFTGNPLTTATDELLIDASWGLGESVVGGTVTPDQYVVHADSMRVLEKVLGSKATRIVRDPNGNHHGGHGTQLLEVSPAQREKYCLCDSEAVDLARLGIKVQDYYGGFPQDIEWALFDGCFYLLQSRPITGVEFSWDADADNDSAVNAHVAPDWVWTRAFADTALTGGTTPLHHSARLSYVFSVVWNDMAHGPGITEAVGMRVFKYWKGEVYYNCHWEKAWLLHMAIPSMRNAECMRWVPKTWHEDIAKSPFSVLRYIKSLVSTHLFDERIFGFKKMMADFHTRVEEIRGLPPDELRKFTDRELKYYIRQRLDLEIEVNGALSPALGEQYLMLMSLLSDLLRKWYDGSDPVAIFSQLLAGSTEQTDTQIENHALWKLAQIIRNSPELAVLFREHQGTAFFTACEASEAGRAFLAEYKPFAFKYAHRGHADRDYIYERRGDDPGIDYPAFQALLSAKNPVDPEEMELKVNARREATLGVVLENVKRKSLGFLRAEVIKFLYYRVHAYIVLRDNERQFPNDMVVMSHKRAFVEMGKRLHERGIIDSPRDIFFLGWAEATELFDGHMKNLTLMRAKITARRRDWDRRSGGRLPKYLRRNRAVEMDGTGPATAGADGGYIGTPTSSGNVTGRARVIRKVSEIGRVEEGDILVTYSTDPGWTPVFLVIKGVVVETGGALSHASCLAREYGFPAVQIEGAMNLIPDGAIISVDGNTGAVAVLEEAEVA